jgi:hypothetical protein
MHIFRQSEETQETASNIAEKSITLKQTQRMSSCSTSSDDSLPCRAVATSADVIQSPSRARQKSYLVVKKVVPLIYSPLAEGYEENHSSSTSATSNCTSASSFLPRIPNPADFTSRWEFMSTLAGDHRQSAHVLDVSHRRIQPAALKFGITPLIAKNITDFSFNRDFFGKHELPSFLDLVKELFPNLERLNLKGGPEATKAKFPKSTELSDEGKIFSADGSDEDKILANDSSHLLEKFDAAIAMAQRETERMQRLYILYRLPNLLFINEKEVTEEEKKLARPHTLNCQKIQNYEWVTATMLPSKEQKDPASLQYYCTEEDVSNDSESDDAGLEVEINISPKQVVSIKSELQSHSPQPPSESSSIQIDPSSEAKVNSPTSLLRMFPRTGRSIARKSEDNSPAKPALLDVEPVTPARSNPPKILEASLPKLNLDTFLQKGNAKNMVHRKSPKAVSEATDTAIAGTGRLISKLSLKSDLQDNNTDKENISKPIRNRRGGRNQDEKKPSPLLGSMVKVKIKKRRSKSSSRPPPSPLPASASRMSFRSRLKRRNSGRQKRVLSTVSLVDDDDDDDEEEGEGDDVIPKVIEDRSMYYESTRDTDSNIDHSYYHT